MTVLIDTGYIINGYLQPCLFDRVRSLKINLMNYKVHRLEIDLEKDPYKLETFLNKLKGEVVSVIPNLARTSLLQIYGRSRKIDFLVVVEKVA